jgi:hypothetical protein
MNPRVSRNEPGPITALPRRAAAALLLLLALSAGGVRAAQPGLELQYRTQPGDTLIGLGQRLLERPGDWRRIQRLNRIDDPYRMPVGRVLRIPAHLLRMEPQQAEVAVIRGSAHSAGAVLDPGKRLAEGSRIVTGEDGYVTIRLADGSLLTLQPRSTLDLESLRRRGALGLHATRLRLEQGRIEAESVPQREGSQQILRTPGAVVAVRGTRYRAAAPAADRGTVEVTEGRVGVSAATGASAIALAAGFGVAATAGRPLTAPVPLLAAPDLAGVSALQERVTIRLRFPPLPQATAYRAQLAADAAFREVVAEQLAPAPELRFAGPPDGDYWVRVRGIDARGLEGMDASRALQLRARPEPPFPSAPADGAKVRCDCVDLAWSAAAEAASYVLQISSGTDFEAPLLERATPPGATGTRLEGLAHTDYRWRVASVRADGRRGPFGDAQRFQLRPAPAQPDPPSMDDDSLRFAWPAEPGQRFEFQLAGEPEFRTVLHQAALDQPAITLTRPPPGSYYMRVRATDPDGFVGPYTAVQRFEVPAPRPWWLLLILVPLAL